MYLITDTVLIHSTNKQEKQLLRKKELKNYYLKSETDSLKLQKNCCELVYADFVGSLQDTGVEKALFKEVTIEAIDRYGAKLNGLYGISCYDIQNGYYNDNIRFDLKDEQGNVVASTDFIETKFIPDFELDYRKERFVNPTNLLDT